MVGVDAALAVQCQMEIKQAGIGAGLEDGALFAQGFGAGVVGGQAGGAVDRAVLAGQFRHQQFLSVGVTSDFLECQQGDEAFLKGAEAAFDFAFGIGCGLHPKRTKQNGFSPLRIPFILGVGGVLS